ncbi:MAG TPA: hypothetical protein VF012_02680, partial [Nocardioidaceae bacterium]
MTSADDQHESTTAGTSPAVGPEGPAGDVAAGEAEAGSATVTDREGGDMMSGTEAEAGMANDTPTELVADLDALKKALESTEDDAVEAISSALAKLNESSQKMGAAMYAAGEAGAA